MASPGAVAMPLTVGGSRFGALLIDVAAFGLLVSAPRDKIFSSTHVEVKIQSSAAKRTGSTLDPTAFAMAGGASAKGNADGSKFSFQVTGDNGAQVVFDKQLSP